jgi:hypothetical protein
VSGGVDGVGRCGWPQLTGKAAGFGRDDGQVMAIGGSSPITRRKAAATDVSA